MDNRPNESDKQKKAQENTSWTKDPSLAGLDPDMAVRALHDRLARGCPIRYEFNVQLMDPARAQELDFDPLDDTKIWPEDQFPLMKVGTLTVNENPSNFFTQIEQAAFCPTNIVPGIEFSADKMLQGRTFSYADTQRYRIGANFAQLPVNQPAFCPHNHQQDGEMAYCNPPGNINYKPNSLDGNAPAEAPAPCYPGMRYPGGCVVRQSIRRNIRNRACRRLQFFSFGADSLRPVFCFRRSAFQSFRFGL